MPKTMPPATRQESRDEDGNTLPCRKGRRCGEPLRDDGTCWICDHSVGCASNQPAGKDADCDCGALGEEDERMTALDSLRLAVGAAMGEHSLLNGGGLHPDDEDETVEVPVESMSELVHGRDPSKGAAA